MEMTYEIMCKPLEMRLCDCVARTENELARSQEERKMHSIHRLNKTITPQLGKEAVGSTIIELNVHVNNVQVSMDEPPRQSNLEDGTSTGDGE